MTDEIVYKVTGRPHRNDIRRMMEWLLNQDFKYCMDSIEVNSCKMMVFMLVFKELMLENGLALNDVLTDLYEEVCEADLPDIPKAEILSVS